jgi:dTDP-4-dehydrorhamnose reductase
MVPNVPSARTLILGGRGLIASRLAPDLLAAGHSVHAPGRAELDVTDNDAVARLLDEIRPDLVVNAAAFLNTERCEADPASSDAVNRRAPIALGKLVAARPGMRLIHFSTDFVFDGVRGGYVESDLHAPLSVYGRHKSEADLGLAEFVGCTTILRVASVIGAPLGKRDFIQALLDRLANGAQGLDVNAEFEISLSTTGLVADVVCAAAARALPTGLYHCAARGKTTWYAVAERALARLGKYTSVKPVPASAYPMPTPRPPKSWMVVDKLATVLTWLPDWQSALDREMDRLAFELSAQVDVDNLSQPLMADR